ncbi:MAG: FeoB-associated Cys-rich membrane protein [Bacteroidaceae bacterium]|nr:FeoB-associated Cys-rich membrane protein [Bacteroidaceae bacterium]
MNLATILVVAAVAAGVVYVLFRMHRNRRKGRSCCGCPLNCVCKKSTP